MQVPGAKKDSFSGTDLANQVSRTHVYGAQVAPPITAGEAKQESENTVTMVFPRPVILTLQDWKRVNFPQGVVEVPESLADHPYLAANGVKPYNGAPVKGVTMSHVKLLQNRGMSVSSLAEAQQYYSKLTPMEQQGFLLAAEGVPAAEPREKATIVDLKFLQSRGYKLVTVEDAQKFLGNMLETQLADYNKARSIFAKGLVGQITTTPVEENKSAELTGGEPVPQGIMTPGDKPAEEEDPIDPPANGPAQVNLDTMTKAQLMDHAKQNHDLDLNPSQTKADMIAAINDVAAAPKE